jgi:glycosyltransferase 2 family protein
LHTVQAPSPTTAGPGAPRSAWTWLKPLVGVVIIGVLVWRVGTGPFLDGLRLIGVPALLAAVAIGALLAVCCAWRWSLIATAVGFPLPVRTAVADCYRSIFLNSTLPSGVLGDVERGVHRGRDGGDVGKGLRAVVWERLAGQLVQGVLALLVLATFPSPVRHAMPAVLAVAAAAAVAAVLVRRHARRPAAFGTAAAEIRTLADPRVWPGVGLASVVVVAGNLVVFVIAARTAGATAPLTRLVPLLLLALIAMTVPANVAGFGPREGVAAWVFGAAGLSAAQGVSAAVVYGALVLAGSLPGAAVLFLRRAGKHQVPAGGGAAAVPGGAASA